MAWAVAVNNVAAVEILVGCGWVRAAGLVGIGAACRGFVSGAVLSAVGLSGGMGEMGEMWGVREVVDMGRRLLGL